LARHFRKRKRQRALVRDRFQVRKTLQTSTEHVFPPKDLARIIVFSAMTVEETRAKVTRSSVTERGKDNGARLTPIPNGPLTRDFE
jgi:hypothetical protein